MATASTLAPYMSWINPDKYDRFSGLSIAELQALAKWVPGSGHHRLREDLARLHEPLADILTRTQYNKAGSSRTLSVILKEVKRTGSAYWVWEEQGWLNGPRFKAGDLARPCPSPSLTS